ncbi:hypothetical protein EYC84_001921 [Monilinia fructicola]|uniref:Uncharacterized protein n=1 Tax=Monilinia fructicola TaxID=38448 RepID=A0A5M9JRT2_MONFR|nr:hypothetical protein EYC84_001921 [Monilinia fructicola]
MDLAQALQDGEWFPEDLEEAIEEHFEVHDDRNRAYHHLRPLFEEQQALRMERESMVREKLASAKRRADHIWAYEAQNPRGTLSSKSALHFDHLEDAAIYLFAVKERDRAAITHLMLPASYSLSRQHRDSGTVLGAWEAIMNYFSYPWMRGDISMRGTSNSPGTPPIHRVTTTITATAWTKNNKPVLVARAGPSILHL